jgi:hypothetical protein
MEKSSRIFPFQEKSIVIWDFIFGTRRARPANGFSRPFLKKVEVKNK